MHRRLIIVLSGVVVAAMVIAGLFIHGWIGGLLLLATAAILVSLTRLNWGSRQRPAQIMRVLIILLVAGVGIAKLIHN